MCLVSSATLYHLSVSLTSLSNSFNELLVSAVAVTLYRVLFFPPVFSFFSGSSRRGAWMLNINLLRDCETSCAFYWNKHMNQGEIKNNDIFICPFLKYLYPFFLWLHSMTSHRNPLWVFFFSFFFQGKHSLWCNSVVHMGTRVRFYCCTVCSYFDLMMTGWLWCSLLPRFFLLPSGPYHSYCCVIQT